MGNAFAAFPIVTAGIGIPLLVLQHGGTGSDGQPQLELSVVAEDAPRQSLARMQLPWTAAQ